MAHVEPEYSTDANYTVIVDQALKERKQYFKFLLVHITSDSQFMTGICRPAIVIQNDGADQAITFHSIPSGGVYQTHGKDVNWVSD